MRREERRHRLVGVGLVAVYGVLWAFVGWHSQSPVSPGRPGGYEPPPLPRIKSVCQLSGVKVKPAPARWERNLFAFNVSEPSEPTGPSDGPPRPPESKIVLPLTSASDGTNSLDSPSPSAGFLRYHGRIVLGSEQWAIIETPSTIRPYAPGEALLGGAWRIKGFKGKQVCLEWVRRAPSHRSKKIPRKQRSVCLKPGETFHPG